MTAYTWNSFVSGSWNDSSRWFPSGAPYYNGDIAEFSPTGVGVATINIPSSPTVVISTLSLWSTPTSTYTLSGSGAIRMNGTAPKIYANTSGAGSQTPTIASSLWLHLDADTEFLRGDLLVQARITGGKSLIKSDFGALTLTNGANDYAGATTINAGVLAIGHSGALGQGSLILNGGAFRSTVNAAITNAVQITDDTTIATAAGATLIMQMSNLHFATGAGAVLHIGRTGDTGTILWGPQSWSGSLNHRISIDAGTFKPEGSMEVTPIHIAAGATLDLGYSHASDTFGALSGAGRIINSSTGPIDLTVNGDTQFSGAIVGTTGINPDTNNWVKFNGSNIDLSGATFTNWINIGEPYVGGDDTVWLTGTAGADTLIGSPTDDEIRGGDGGDTLRGGAGADVLFAGAGDDQLTGGPGIDRLHGEAGFDYARYDQAPTGVAVNLANGASNSGEAAGDWLTDIEGIAGSAFADTLTGNAQNNTLLGQGGDDLLTGGAGADTIDGGAGSDTLSFMGATTGMTLQMGSTGPNSGQVFAGDPIGMDTFANIEHILGGEGNDTIGCDGQGNFVAGFGGADTIFGWTGNDTFWGGNGNDQLFGQQGNDTLAGDAGNDKLYGWAGNDTLTGGSGADSFMWTGAGEGTDIVTDYSYAQGDLIDVVGNPASFSFYQAGTSVLIIDPGTGQAIFNITNYSLSNGLAIV